MTDQLFGWIIAAVALGVLLVWGGRAILERVALLIGIAVISAMFGQDQLARALNRWLTGALIVAAVLLCGGIGCWAVQHVRFV